MKALWFAVLLLLAAIAAGCRAPGTYVTLNRSLPAVQEDILRYVQAQERSPACEDAGVAQALAERLQSPELASIPWGQTKCLHTNSVPNRTFAAQFVTYRFGILDIFGPQLTVIEARHKKPNATRLRVYCSRGERIPSPLFDLFRNESRECEIILALDL
jgi:hypothetical protein